MNEKLWMPAQDLDAEQAVIGGVLLDNNAFDEVSDIITAEHFYNPSNGQIWTAMTGLLRQGINVDAITLRDELKRRNWFEECGADPYLWVLLETVPHSAHSVRYAVIVREKADQRNARYALTEAVRALDGGGSDLHDIIHKVDGKLLSLLEISTRTQELQVSGAVTAALTEIERRMGSDSDVSGLASGFTSLDNITTGFHPASLNILAARPSMGKTALVGNIGYSIAKAGQSVLFCSLEQTKTEIVERLIAAVGKVDAHAMRTGRLNSQEQDRIQQAAAEIASVPLFIDDRPGRTLQQVRAVARRTLRKHGLDVVILDYLQILQPDNRNAPREQQVADLSRGLKTMAKELNVPIIALAQLNRCVEGRADKRPLLSDLRESGSIEQDADVVLFLHRPDKYDSADQPGVAELGVSKNRNGVTGSITLGWQGSWMRFTDTH